MTNLLKAKKQGEPISIYDGVLYEDGDFDVSLLPAVASRQSYYIDEGGNKHNYQTFALGYKRRKFGRRKEVEMFLRGSIRRTIQAMSESGVVVWRRHPVVWEDTFDGYHYASMRCVVVPRAEPAG